MTRYTKQDSDGCYYIESVNGKLESDKYGHVYGESIDRFAELENANLKAMSYTMTLKEFISSFVCKNTLIRLWIKHLGGHRMLVHPSGKEVCMEWAILDGSGWSSVFSDWKVIGVTDILCDSYMEAINIVIVKDGNRS